MLSFWVVLLSSPLHHQLGNPAPAGIFNGDEIHAIGQVADVDAFFSVDFPAADFRLPQQILQAENLHPTA